MSDDVEFWPDPHAKFVYIAQMFSELIALSSTGQLYQWRWTDTEPYKHPVEVRRSSKEQKFLLFILTLVFFKLGYSSSPEDHSDGVAQ